MSIVVFLVIAGVGIWLWARLEMRRREEEREAELRASYKQRIADDARNAGAWEALADSLRRAGRLHEARDAYDGALAAGADELALSRTRYKRQQIERELAAQERESGSGPFWKRDAEIVREFYFCNVCGAPNPPRARHCEACAARMPAESFWEALRDREILRSSIEGVIMIAVLGLVFRIFDAMPLEVKGLLIMSATIVLGWRFLQAIEGRKG